MVKRVALLFMCIISIASLLCGCCCPLRSIDDLSSSDVSSVYLPEEIESSEERLVVDSADESVVESVEETPSIPQPAPQPALPDWKTAYINFINENQNGYTKFALAYIDNDDIPELYGFGVCSAQGDVVCSFKNGKIIELHLGRTGGVSYIERSGLVINQNGHMDYYYTEAYKLTSDGFTTLLNAAEIVHYEDLENGDYDSYSEYTVEDKPATKEEFDAAIAAVFDFSKSKHLYDIAVSYETIKQQILNY